MKRDYIDHLISSIDCDLSGLRVLVDCANGAASATAPDLFDGLPLHADFIHREPDGVNINDGCGSTHLESLSEGVVARRLRHRASPSTATPTAAYWWTRRAIPSTETR